MPCCSQRISCYTKRNNTMECPNKNGLIDHKELLGSWSIGISPSQCYLLTCSVGMLEHGLLLASVAPKRQYSLNKSSRVLFFWRCSKGSCHSFQWWETHTASCCWQRTSCGHCQPPLLSSWWMPIAAHLAALVCRLPWLSSNKCQWTFSQCVFCHGTQCVAGLLLSSQNTCGKLPLCRSHVG